jgi:antitoxin component YwqK of YwqJK toxin-antitoxin module
MKKDIINKNDNGEYHGIQIGYYPNGQIYHKHNYINGKKHGIQIGYYTNGQISCKHNYINGQLHGEVIGCYDNGKEIMYKYYYINGHQVSKEEWIAYNRKLKMDMMSNL